MLLSSTLRRGAVVASAMLLGAWGPFSCTGCRASENPAGVGADGATTDALVKVSDAAIGDAFVSDAALPPERWERIPGLPDRCGERVASAPNEAVPPLVFSACGSGRAGCTHLLAEWNPSSEGGIYGVEPEPIRRIGSQPTFTYVRAERTTSRVLRAFFVVESAGKERSSAVGVAPGNSGDDCVARIAFSESGVALQVLGVPSQYVVGLARAPTFWPFETVSLPVGALDPKDNGVVMQAFGSTSVAYYRNAGTSSLYDFRTKQAKAVMVDGFAWTPWGEGALTFGSDSGAALPARIGYLAPDGTLNKLVDPGPGRLIAAMAVDRGVTPNQLVWIEGADAGVGLASSEVWTSPLSTAASGIQRRLVAKTPLAHGVLRPIVADRGRVVMPEDRNSARVIRLSDGKGWKLQAEPGDGIPDVLGFDDESVWVSIVKDNPALSGLGSANGILRMRLDSLGEPTLSNGL